MTEQLSLSETAVIEHACAKLYYRLGLAADANFAGFIDCFSRDIVWVRPTMEMRGLAEVKSFLDQEVARITPVNGIGHMTRHLYTNIVIDVVDRGKAHGRAYATIYRDERFDGQLPAPMAEPEVIVEYKSEFSLEDGAWKISRHMAWLVMSRHATKRS